MILRHLVRIDKRYSFWVQYQAARNRLYYRNRYGRLTPMKLSRRQAIQEVLANDPGLSWDFHKTAVWLPHAGRAKSKPYR